LPISEQAQPRDLGVAVYFRLKNADICLPCDAWNRVEHNPWAVVKDIEAQRGRLRWGVGSVEQAFAGYAALPAPGRDWHEVLGLTRSISTTKDSVDRAFRELSQERHPDRGGSHEAMSELNRARQEALKEQDGEAVLH
jgi:hypothetical protein